ncbi:MAG TPA: biotin--[acetyl-CoA-carboxylase] ligase [Flavitalea sp.]|nr:biotin--[acetyl-CoA-carboxylase] ligase [Flavitalea sp.]
MAQTPSHPPIGQPFIVLPRVDSTNNYAMAQVHAGRATHGTTWFAHEQTAGKGQRGRQWITEPNQNIIISIVFEPELLSLTKTFQLSALISLGCYDFFKIHGGNPTKLKWPNDIYWRDRKAGGILIENIFRGANWLFSVAGIGINVNQDQFPDSVQNAVSLKQITGRQMDPLSLAHELCGLIEKYTAIQRIQSFDWLAAYNACLYKKNESVKFKKDNVVFETVIRGVNENGQLQTIDAVDRTFEFGELEWIK